MMVLVCLLLLLSDRLCLHIVHGGSASEVVPLWHANIWNLKNNPVTAESIRQDLDLVKNDRSCRVTLGAITTLKAATEKRIQHAVSS